MVKVQHQVAWPVHPREAEAIKQGKSQLHMRFALEEDGVLKFPPRWPASVCIRVNGHVLFNTLTTGMGLFAESASNEGPPPTIDITPRLDGNWSSAMIHVSFKSLPSEESNRQWIVAGLCVTEHSDAAVNAMVERQSQPLATCQERVRKLMQDGGDVVCASIDVKLTDPLTAKRIEKAGRGKACAHLQCFDVGSFLAMQRAAQVPPWKCTHCLRPLKLADLVYDAWFQSLLAQTENDLSASGCAVSADCSWKTVYDAVDSDVSSQSDDGGQGGVGYGECGNDDDDDDGDCGGGCDDDGECGGGCDDGECGGGCDDVPVFRVLPPPKRVQGTHDAPIELLDSDDELF